MSLTDQLPGPDPACPKHMVYGPCGGVHDLGDCEVDDRRCPFVDRPLVSWEGTSPPASASGRMTRVGTALDDGRAVIGDLRVRPMDLESVAEVAGRLAPVCDAVLVGEHQSRPDFPPVMMAHAVAEAGAEAWITLTCRDRNRVVLEAELAGLAAVGVAGVHCVTGDARAPGVRCDATQVFDLDSLRLVGSAVAAGLRASVAATPVAPPRHLRPLRVVEKQRAGASVCFVNHCGGAREVARFAAACRVAGASLDMVACVPLFTDVASARVLERFPGLELDPALLARVLEADDPVAAGMEAAVDEALACLAIPEVAGINLSGSATAGSEHRAAAIMAETAARIRQRLDGMAPGSDVSAVAP